ncbi:2-hydroxy-3-keto-5-methylthiopentenyl-1-phosphate phosphatase [Picosynechococcus sp. PCC 7003]|uniref:HAD-IB family phosphatase n=1 Tax=Picosynechococcus sp. PCC 7003 TaxID=374981 RepID=UPI0008109072|nr:HAD-IB family phosphatase [Picosynechococcus sp. PCC 7003]ANV85471.1 2-hydroxy-3-keto-5-methylthiopentenyl-1-phosphate phosphatase [Picosynechococcus sp. PCC 7003]
MDAQTIVFCDFDGTITTVDTFGDALGKYAPEVAADILPGLYDRKITLREGVRKILEAIPSEQFDAFVGEVDDKPVRQGFSDFLQFLGDRQVPIVVVSGGLVPMVERVLARPGTDGKPLRDHIETVAAMNIDTLDPYFKIIAPFEGGTEMVEKVQVMGKYKYQKAIAIGDSLTDINMALKADLVFARDRLQQYLDAEGKSYVPWETFDDIRAYLETNGLPA